MTETEEPDFAKAWKERRFLLFRVGERTLTELMLTRSRIRFRNPERVRFDAIGHSFHNFNVMIRAVSPDFDPVEEGYEIPYAEEPLEIVADDDPQLYEEDSPWYGLTDG